MKIDLKIVKNTSFVFISIIGLLYIIFQFLLLQKIIESCVAIFVSSYGFNLDIETFKLIFSNPRSFLVMISMSLFVILSVRTILALIRMVSTIYRSYQFQRFLDYDTKEGYREFESSNMQAFTLGISSPQVYISNKLVRSVSGEELKSIVLHEQAHKLAKDPLKTLIINFFRNAMPNIGGIRWLFQSYELIVELSADNFVHNFVSRKHTASALLKTIETHNGLALNNFNAHSERIKILTQQKKFNILFYFVVLVTTLSIFTLMSMTINQTQALNSCTQVESCFINTSNTSTNDLMSKEIVEFCELRNRSEI